MPTQLTSYRIFIASPGGLNDERRAFHEVIDKFNKTAAIHDGVLFQAVGWEATLGGVGRPQSLINKELSACDFFVLMLWDRWGSPPDDATSPFTSGTHEEYQTAMDCVASGTMQQMVLLFKKVDEKQLSDPGAQLQQVIDFRKKLEKERQHLFQNFDSTEHFKELLNDHLHEWLRWGRDVANSSGNAPVFPSVPSGPVLAPATSEATVIKETRKPKDSNFDAAWALANEGNLTEAEISFSRIVINSKTTANLIEYGKFLVRIGLLDRAQAMFKEAEDVAKQQQDMFGLSRSYTNLAGILNTRGNLFAAEELYRKSLAISEKLGRQGGMAAQYGNLGNILVKRGDLDGAEEMLRKSLAISEKLGRQGGMAAQYGNLGIVLRMRGDLEGAEEMYRKSLLINEQLGQQDGIANQYGNIGVILQMRGDLDGAEEMHRKSLAINEQLGRLDGMIAQYGNLGLILRKRRDLDGAEEMHRKSLAISEKLGRQDGIASQYSNLGNILTLRRDLDGAEEMHRKSLAINEQLGRKEGIAGQYGNLGLILKMRGDKDGAEELFSRSLEIAKEMNSGYLIEKAEKALFELRSNND